MCIETQSLKIQKIRKLNFADSSNFFANSRNSWAYFNTNDDDGDSVCEWFEVNENDSLNNFVQITKQENDFSELWGNFSVSFNKTSDCKNRFYPNELLIRNGTFHVFVK